MVLNEDHASLKLETVEAFESICRMSELEARNRPRFAISVVDRVYYK